jgi:hypothetical protein
VNRPTRPSNKRGVLAHLGLYIIIIGTLSGINMLASPGELWFLYPAIVWGAGLTFHLFLWLPLNRLKPAWRRFLRHLGLYLIIVSALSGVAILASADGWWIVYPVALIWGAVVALHFHFGILLAKDRRSAISERTGTTRRRGQIVNRPLRAVKLSNKRLQTNLNQALTYKTQIDQIIGTTPHQHVRDRLQTLTGQVEVWLTGMVELAYQLDQFQRDRLIRQDLEVVPKSIRTLEAQLARETDEASRVELQRTLANRRQQLEALEQLRRIVHRTEMRIERSLSSLGTLYSQVLAGQSVSRLADYNHLATEVDEELLRLQDHLDALHEIKLGQVR